MKKKNTETTTPISDTTGACETYTFRKPPIQPGEPECDSCYGLGWSIQDNSIERCAPCDTYSDDVAAGTAAASALADMYTKLKSGEQLASGVGYEAFVLHPLPGSLDACPECDGGLASIEAGYDRYGTVSLENRVLLIEDGGFSENGNGPHYLFCSDCDRAYTLPVGKIDYR